MQGSLISKDLINGYRVWEVTYPGILPRFYDKLEDAEIAWTTLNSFFNMNNYIYQSLEKMPIREQLIYDKE